MHIRTLRDTQQFSDPEGAAAALGVSEAIWPLFGVIWESSKVLARLMQTFDIKGKRILEIGCGVGLSSIMLNSRHADITATDHHPEAQDYLKVNVLLNDGDPIAFERTGWEEQSTTLGDFDLIIGSDILYQPNHAELLSGFISRHAKASCEVIIVDPARGNLAKFEKAMALEGFVKSDLDIAPYLSEDVSYSGRLRSYKRTAA